MDKIKKYQAIIIALLKEYEQKGSKSETYIITDTIHHHYQVVRAGWDSKNHYYFRVRMHLNIRNDGKIWIMENQTEDEISEILVDRDIPKTDIVIGILPESVRMHTGYAVA